VKLLRFVSLFSTLTIVMIAAPSNSVIHAKQPAVLIDAEARPAGAPEKFSATKQIAIFGKAVAYDSGGDPAAPLVVADVNGDGKPDVVVGNGSTAVDVLLGNGDGTLQAPVSYFLNSQVESIAIGDVNGDGKPDLVVATYSEAGNPNSSGVSVLLGNGNGTFQQPISYNAGGYVAVYVAIADANGDGHPDLIVINKCQNPTDCGSGFGGNIGLLFGNGNGTFQAAIVSFVPSDEIFYAAVADLNGDGTPDVVVGGGNLMGVLLGNGDGTFQPLVGYSSGNNTSTFALAVGDVNGDGKPDVVQTVVCFAGCPNSGVSVFLGNGDGTFQSPIVSNFTQRDAFSSIALSDLDGDGKPDVVTSGWGSARAYVLLSNGDGTFQAAQRYASGLKYTWSVAVADLNADGKPDLLMANQCGTKCKGTDLNLQVRLNVFDATTATAVTSSVNPAVVNQSVTFTATIASSSTIPDGAVITFSTSKISLGTGTTKNGIASLTTSFAKAKTYTIKASYPGDAFHKASAGSVKQMVTH